MQSSILNYHSNVKLIPSENNRSFITSKHIDRSIDDPEEKIPLEQTENNIVPVTSLILIITSVT